MQKFIINGGKTLKGVVEIGGYKNAAGPILAATLLTKEECVIDNLSRVTDVFNLIKVLESIGVEVEWIGKNQIKIKAGEKVDPDKMDYSTVEKMRISVLLIGPLLARFKKFKIPHPGGDKIGLRPIDSHLEALRKLGAEIYEENNFYYFDAKNLQGKEVILNEFSVTATENLMMAASLVSGTTVIKTAAAEPQVQDTGDILKKMGVEIEGVGTHQITIKGQGQLHGVNHSVIPDPLEAGTFIVLAIATQSEIKIKNVIISHLELFLEKLREIGANFEIESNSVIVKPSQNLRATKIQSLPFPGFPTDLQPMVSVLLTQTEGKSLVHDPLYESRLGHLKELKKMGADIEIADPHRAFIFGPTPLNANKITGMDIRAGASLIIAALISKGKSEIYGVEQIDRGYEKIDEKLRKLGAEIKRIEI
ncbi:MAG: UDP-N-acetylglucosamine 1-carboxyvinyltransferase [Candidatus Pacebacteria bacterium]|nr:UDP-N-acetylglucosamine 1-carboxyvinyltransferase [Candidatus Paceibacterota bacterium]